MALGETLGEAPRVVGVLSLTGRRCAPRSAWGAAVGAALALAASVASAHAPPLGARVLTPASAAAGPEEVIVTNRGLVFRDRDSQASRLLCNEALRINTAELPNVALLADGGLLVATSSGLRASHDRGCTWSDVGQMETTNTPALGADPGDPNRVFVASYDSDVPGLRETRDGGTTWSLAYPTEAGDYVHSILISAADPARVYATLTTYGPSGPPAHSLLRTRDGGASWQRVVLPLNEKDYLATAAAVSPADPDTLVLYTVANSPGLDDARLLVSRDAGDRFDAAFENPEIRGAGYGADQRLWVAARDGLYAANAELSSFLQTSSASELGCVGESAGSLFVCGHYAGLTSAESGIGISTDGGQSFRPWLDFAQVDTPVECPADSLTASLCARPWLDWQTEMLGGVPVTTPGAYGPVGSSGAPPAPASAPSPSASPMTALDPAPALDVDASGAEAAGCSIGDRSLAAKRSAPWALLLAVGHVVLRRAARRRS